MAFGKDGCKACEDNPAYMLLPCGDKVCSDCHSKAPGDAMSCNACGNFVRELVKVTTTPTLIFPKDLKTSILRRKSGSDPGPLRVDTDLVPTKLDTIEEVDSANSAAGGVPLPDTMDFKSFGAIGSDGSASDHTDANTGSNKSYGEMSSKATQGSGKENAIRRVTAPTVPVTPTPPTNTRYVPPAMRGSAPTFRSSSAAPNMSITSQAPATHHRGPHPTPITRLSRAVGSSPYRFTSQQLTPHAAMDPFTDAPPFKPTYTNGPPSQAMGMYQRQSPRAPIQARATLAQNNLAARIPKGSNATIMNAPVRPIRRDSVSKAEYAEYLAKRIMNGDADDPTDIDYGNPGRSRRLPPEPPKNIMSDALPQARGRVAYPIVAPSAQPLPNTKGNSVAYQSRTEVAPPAWLWELYSSNTHPTVETVMEDLPLIEACRVAVPTTAGVIKITGAPFTCGRSEIVAVLGRQAQIVPQPSGTMYHAVHINMERQSGKTMDAYVEVANDREARLIASQMERRTKEGRQPKIGDRAITVKVITQGDLMAELFPHAKNCTWHGPVPVIDYDHEDFGDAGVSKGFAGFLNSEELVHMIKHAENPQRSPFAQRCLVRTFDHLVTVLHKYPWFAVEHVRAEERFRIYDTTYKSIRALIERLAKDKFNVVDKTKPTTTTLQELLVAALTCPGFSDRQKSSFAKLIANTPHAPMLEGRGMNIRFGGVDQYGPIWPFSVLVKRPGVCNEMVEYVASALRAATESASTPNDPPPRREDHPLFGEIPVDYNTDANLGEAGRHELVVIKEMLSRVLPSVQALPEASSTSTTILTPTSPS